MRNNLQMYLCFGCLVVLLLFPCGVALAEIPLDQRPAGAGEWGYHPAEGALSSVNPPSFAWRPQAGIVRWEVECAPAADPGSIEYRADGIEMNVHCPPRTFSPGEYTWRYRGTSKAGERTNWSRPRRFRIAENAATMPLPPRDELLARVPKDHPRLFIRPEDLPRLRQLARGPMRTELEELVAECDRLMADPPPTDEPPKYGPEIVRNSDAWREIWWGNRQYTIRALNGAATLAFTRLLGGKEEYGELATRILLECAEWDPHGSTGYRYNDEAGMPYAYYFSRTYSFVHDMLSEEERELCRRVLKARGEEMYEHLYPRHLWEPYSSHSNRAWHFLGEVGIATLGEVEGADDWIWFAMNVFYNVYPVWSGDDGGWHEGYSYWQSYINRFTWWADVMRSALRVNAYEKPYFSKIGYYSMYLMPPGKVGGGFGDLNARRRASDAVPLVSQLATQAGNGHWQWYVEQMGGPEPATGYIGFIRGTLPPVAACPPQDLPASKLFSGIGQAVLNTTLHDADQDVQLMFKSSPFGTQSHGYEANNSFLLWAYGRRLLIRSGYRDSYGSDHHRDWMWSTRSVNNITLGGIGQLPHSADSKGKILGFETTPTIDAVAGEAGSAYRDTEDGPSRLDRFTRVILFAKPELVIVFDRLKAKEKTPYEYWLHSTHQFTVNDQRGINLRVDDVHCEISFLAPEGLEFTQTDQYDPNPRPRITLREWHLTAHAPPAKQTAFITLFRPHRSSDKAPQGAQLRQVDGGYVLTAELSDGQLTALLPTDDDAQLSAPGISTRGAVVVQRQDQTGNVLDIIRLESSLSRD